MSTTVHVSPLPRSFFLQIAIVDCLAFAHGRWCRWLSTTLADAVIEMVEQIPALRLSKVTRDFLCSEKNPRVVLLCVVIDKEVAGFAQWVLPSGQSRKEALRESLVRKWMELKNYFQDWLSPPKWLIETRWKKYQREQRLCANRILNPESLDDVWYLKTLAVHPKFHRMGVGGTLVEWGQNQARATEGKVYLEASESGKGLYLKKGFKIAGYLTVEDDNNQLVETCMLWNSKAT
jgi:ribosomal protein S18 acetylase RimI-like enzyme